MKKELETELISRTAPEGVHEITTNGTRNYKIFLQ